MTITFPGGFSHAREYSFRPAQTRRQAMSVVGGPYVAYHSDEPDKSIVKLAKVTPSWQAITAVLVCSAGSKGEARSKIPRGYQVVVDDEKEDDLMDGLDGDYVYLCYKLSDKQAIETNGELPVVDIQLVHGNGSAPAGFVKIPGNLRAGRSDLTPVYLCVKPGGRGDFLRALNRIQAVHEGEPDKGLGEYVLTASIHASDSRHRTQLLGTTVWKNLCNREYKL